MATLKELVNETTNIKDELKTCHTNLKNNLVEKGVECSDNDKMLSLINKVEQIKTGSKFASGISSINQSNSSIKVSGLDFEPNIVIIRYKYSSNTYVGIFHKTYTYINSSNWFILMYANGNTTPTINSLPRKITVGNEGDNVCYGSFSFYITNTNIYTETPVEWIAYE